MPSNIDIGSSPSIDLSYDYEICRYAGREPSKLAVVRLLLILTTTRIILSFGTFDMELTPESRSWQDSHKGTVAWHRTPLMCRYELASNRA